ncbi:MAG: hypothetical protein U0Y82_11140 [Thermoleophilia bacterium]
MQIDSSPMNVDLTSDCPRRWTAIGRAFSGNATWGGFTVDVSQGTSWRVTANITGGGAPSRR